MRFHRYVTVPVAIWLAFLVSCWFVPDGFARTYLIIWAGFIALITGSFVIGYLTLSKPSRDPETGHRNWVSEWAWLPSQAALFFLVFTSTMVFRLLIPVTNPTPEQLLSYHVQSAVFVTALAVQLWIAVRWVTVQIRSRRRLREAKT